MRILLDENMPRPLKRVFRGHVATTVQEEGLAGTRNGELLARIEGTFDVFVTADKNLRYQQNLAGRKIAIVELPTNRLPLLRPIFPRIAATVDSAKPGNTSGSSFDRPAGYRRKANACHVANRLPKLRFSLAL